MKVMVIITGSPARCFILDIVKERRAGRLRRLAGDGRYSDAIVAALSDGIFLEEVPVSHIANKSADLVITEQSAHWDACGR